MTFVLKFHRATADSLHGRGVKQATKNVQQNALLTPVEAYFCLVQREKSTFFSAVDYEQISIPT
jgi:hypothetical protein